MKQTLLFLVFLVATLCKVDGQVEPGKAMIRAANDLIQGLNEAQRSKIMFEVNDTSREIWHYLPVASFGRFGQPLSELNEEQDQLVYNLLESSLGDEGFFKAQQIMSLESVLRSLENNAPNRDPEQYHISIYGKPAKKGIWSWGFSGHHISLHFTMVDGAIASTPTFLGSNPADVPSGPKKGLRVLKDEEELGISLVSSLSKEQQDKAIILDEAPYEIFTKADVRVNPLSNEGIRYAELNDQQKVSLRAIVSEYLAVMPASIAQGRKKKIDQGGWDQIYFAWAGVTDRSAGHYYRIQGPSFLIEFDNTQNNANHVHTVWRDFKGDFGRDLIADHYKTAH